MTSITKYRQIKASLEKLEQKLPPYMPDNAVIDEWKKRSSSGSAALNEDDFPADWAAMALTGLLSDLQKISLSEEDSLQLIVEYDGQGRLPTELCGLDSAILMMYIHLADQWAWQRLAKTVLTVAPPDVSWDYSHCPCCGDNPVAAYFAPEDGSRHLVCGTCHTAWRYRRIGCPYCGEHSHDRLRVLEADEYPGWLIMACQNCRGTLKTADMRRMAIMPDWNEAQLELLPLDFAADKWIGKADNE